MKTWGRGSGAALVLLALALVAPPPSSPAGPTPGGPVVSRVEPPSWWPGHSLNPVRLLIHGSNLGGARIGPAPGLLVGPSRANEAGTYVFVDLTLEATAQPGRRSLPLTTATGRTDVAFDVLRCLPRGGRFQGFSSDDVIYLVMPDRFADSDPRNNDPAVSRGLFDRGKPFYYHGGDLQGILDHLPYLKDLGVTALWLTPLYDNTNLPNDRQKVRGEPVTDYHGYGAVDFYAVEEHFGDLGTLRELVDRAHSLGLKVIQDQVANHTGPAHPWARDPPTPGWLNGTESSHLANDWQVWTLADLHAAPEVQKATLEGWFGNVLPDLNQDDPEVARYLIQNSLWWVGVAGFDGIRQDTLPYVPRRFWAEWSRALKREYPALRIVGECWDSDPSLVAFFQGGVRRPDGIDTGIDSLFDFPLFDAVRRAFAEGKPVRDVAKVLSRDRLYADPQALVTFAGLHDVARFMSVPGATPEGLALALTFLTTTRGIPLIYYGDEIGMEGGDDPDNRRDFPGGFPGDPRNAFETPGRSGRENVLFEHVRRLLHLRRELGPLRRGRLVDLSVGDQAYAYARVLGAASVVVALNNAHTEASFDLEVSSLGLGEGERLADRLGVIPDVAVRRGRLQIRVPARAGVILVP